MRKTQQCHGAKFFNYRVFHEFQAPPISVDYAATVPTLTAPLSCKRAARRRVTQAVHSGDTAQRTVHVNAGACNGSRQLPVRKAI